MAISCRQHKLPCVRTGGAEPCEVCACGQLCMAGSRAYPQQPALIGMRDPPNISPQKRCQALLGNHLSA